MEPVWILDHKNVYKLISYSVIGDQVRREQEENKKIIQVQVVSAVLILYSTNFLLLYKKEYLTEYN